MATVWSKGPFKVVLQLGDSDPPASNEVDLSLRFDPKGIALASGIISVNDAKDAANAMRALETTIAEHLGNLSGEFRDSIRNEAAKLIPGLPKALGWSV